MKNKPVYSLESVDNALLLLQMLRDHGRLRVRQAAADLDIAPSTVHRLLAMLVYRDFAKQDEHRGYVPGPGLAAAQSPGGTFGRLRRSLLPHMELLCDRVDETVNLMVRVGTRSRILASAESSQALHVGDRQGTVLPAAQSSGGKALLAQLSRDELARLYLADGAEWKMPPTAFERLARELSAVRERGYALNVEGTETGVCAIGRCVLNGDGLAVGAISISVPSVRFAQARVGELASALRLTADNARADLAV
jgi:DNA-binding IclR family transcriptional regulator